MGKLDSISKIGLVLPSKDSTHQTCGTLNLHKEIKPVMGKAGEINGEQELGEY